MLLTLLLLVSPIGEEPPLPPHPCPVAARMSARMGIDRARRGWAACDAEEVLHRAGWSDAWVAGALMNAWYESGWNPSAVGDHGRAVGFWQLRDDGLGRGMGDLRYDVRHATTAVVSSAQRQRMSTFGDDPEEATRQFCIRIMRPSDKIRKGDHRARTVRYLSADDPQ
jgi:hypothetical protein